MAAIAPIDDAQHVIHSSSEAAELVSREEHLTACCYDILHDKNAPAIDIGALGEPAGAVGLRRLADEGGFDPRRKRKGGRYGNPAQLEAGENLRPRRYERDCPAHHRSQQSRVCLEQVLVEVVTGYLPGSEREGPHEPAAVVDGQGEPLCVHQGPVWRPWSGGAVLKGACGGSCG